VTPDLRAAAFGAHPDAAVRVRPGMVAADRWLVAVVLGGQGRYAAAATILEDLVTAPRVPPAVAAHAAVTLAAHRRQLGGHATARRLDAIGLRHATAAPPGALDVDGTDARAARVDALVGLAADAVGTGAAGLAQRLLDAAAAAVCGHPAWRLTVRLCWVRAELALLRGDAAAAVAPSRTALELATAGGSVRHVVKSRIVHAVAGAVAGGDACAAIAELDAAGDLAERAGLLSLAWPARYAATDVSQLAPIGVSTANDRAARTAQQSVNGRPNDAARRRHAGAATVSVILRRCDPVGRRLMRVGLGLSDGLPVT